MRIGFSRVLVLWVVVVGWSWWAVSASAAKLGEIAQVGGFGSAPGQFSYPTDLAADPADNSVYVLDEPGAEESGPNAVFRIQKFSASLGAPVASVEVATPAASGRLQVVNGIAIDSKLKRLYVLVSSCAGKFGFCEENGQRPTAERILAYSTEQTAGGELPPATVEFNKTAGVFYEFPPSGAGAVERPGGIAVDPVDDGMLVFGETTHGEDVIQQVTIAESHQSGASGETFDDTEGRLGPPSGAGLSGLTVGPEGDVYVAAVPLSEGDRGVTQLGIEGEGHSLANPAIRALASDNLNNTGPWPLTGGIPARRGRTAGEQVAVAPEGGIVYATEVSEEDAFTDPEGGSFELRGMSTSTGRQVVVFGNGPGGASPKCHISTEANTVAAGSSGIVYALDEGRPFSNPTTGAFEPSQFGFRLIEFGPGGSGCPIPVAGFGIDGKSEAQEPTVTVKKGATVSFEAATAGLNGEQVKEYQWDLDGSGKYATVATGGQSSVDLQYLQPGTYTIGLKVMLEGGGNYGEPEPVTRTLVVDATPPTPSFEVFPSANLGTALGPGQEIKPEEAVTFNGQESLDPTGSPTGTPTHALKSYTWSFGDGKSETTTKPEYTRSFANATPNARSETVSLSVTSAEGIKSASAVTQALTIEGTPEKAPPGGGGGGTVPPGGGSSSAGGPGGSAQTSGQSPGSGVVKEAAKGAPASKKPLTRAQKLALALKACKKLRSKKAGVRCEKAARQRYAPKHATKRKGKK